MRQSSDDCFETINYLANIAKELNLSVFTSLFGVINEYSYSPIREDLFYTKRIIAAYKLFHITRNVKHWSVEYKNDKLQIITDDRYCDDYYIKEYIELTSETKFKSFDVAYSQDKISY